MAEAVHHDAMSEVQALERLFPESYAPIWREIATYLCQQLSADLPADLGCAELAFALTERLREELGGQQHYLPRGRVDLSERDREIGEAFTGRNLRELVRRYGLSEVRVRQIHAAYRAEQIARRQGRLPFD